MPDLLEDRPLTRTDVQSLSTADSLADFFIRLGYPEDTRLPMTAEALSLNQSLQDATQHVERLTSVEGALEIYLFRLTSVTVAHTRALARAFRDRWGNFLLILTDDYRRIDFVLLERELPGGTKGERTVMRPRVLTVDRTNPDRVALRVLRRFTFTEVDEDGDPDPYAQFDKLKSAFTIAEWSEPFFNNRALFSDYYLNERLPDLDVWEAPGRNRAFREIRGIVAETRPHVRDEPRLVASAMVQPILQTLGFQVATDDTDADLLLYRFPHPEGEGQGGGEDVETCIPPAFALVYPWSRYLDGKDAADPDRPNENPGAQVVSLLDQEVAPWAVVTNGKTWRLYSARAHSRATNYYEIDLEEILAMADPAEAFRYFYLLFRAAAFDTFPLLEGEGQGEGENSFLDWLMDESTAYARELGERLKTRVFESIFPHFARGFVTGLGGAEALLALDEEARQAQLQTVFDGTLTFLYRLLFLLYAESRDLLPVREVRGYRTLSLRQLKETIAEQAGPIEDQVPDRLADAYPLPPQGRPGEGDAGYELYGDLLDLFEVIAAGSSRHNVPIYNGGLFQTEPDPDDESRDAVTARFLLATPMPDRHLALGLDRLARDVDPKRGDSFDAAQDRLGFIDYKSLGVRQLGSIYEGLLEFKVRVAPETMAVVAGAKTEEIVPLREAEREGLDILTEGRGKNAEPRTLPRGTVYLENDRRERKATGSYYTPDHIVTYIVRHTVGPVMDEKLDALRPRLQEAERDFNKQLISKREIQGVEPNEPELLKNMAGDVLRDLFDVKVLDPAMGSGHFLVEAVDYVTDRLVQFLDGFPFLATFFAGMRASILAEMERQQVTIDPSQLTDVTLLKRHVLKRCVYGVDLNPMAVELAKVSLWLDCFTLGAPLSFLDHHLRCGNSLIGAMAQDVAAEMAGPQDAGQMTFLTGPFVGLLRAAEMMRGISRITDVTLDQVRESGALFKAFDRAARPYKQLLDIHIAQHFGVDRAEEFLTLYGADALKADPEKLGRPYRGVIEEGRELYEEKRFFHWDLEFPEVFIDLERAEWKENGGFDAVVGNPPYDVLAEKEREEDLSQTIGFFESDQRFKPSLGRKIDLYRLFLSLSLSVSRLYGKVGLIVPMSLLADQQTGPLREFIIQQNAPLIIDAFPQKDDPYRRVFFEAKLPTCVVVMQKGETESYQTQITVHPGNKLEEAVGTLVIEKINLELFEELFGGIPLVTNTTEIRLLLRLHSSEPYKDLGSELSTYQGEINATTHRDFLSEDPTVGPRVFRGGNVQRYEFIDEAKQGTVLYIRDDEFQTQHEGEKAKHVYRKRFGYQRKAALDNWRRLIFCELPDPPCYCIESISYFLYEGKRSYFFLALLNSQLLEWRFETTSSNNMVSTSEVASLPLRVINFTTPESQRRQFFVDLVNKYKSFSGDAISEMAGLLGQIDELLPKSADNNFLAFKPGVTGAKENGSKEYSDVVHDFLAYLAEQMIAMHKAKQARVDAFWADLKDATAPGTFETLRTRGKWEQSLAKDPTCTPYVDAESRSTRHLDESLGWDAACFEAFAEMLVGKTTVTPALGRVYAKHAPDYRALVDRIAATDDLIDQVVYRLYGLTEEEIAVVEGESG